MKQRGQCKEVECIPHVIEKSFHKFKLLFSNRNKDEKRVYARQPKKSKAMIQCISNQKKTNSAVPEVTVRVHPSEPLPPE